MAGCVLVQSAYIHLPDYCIAAFLCMYLWSSLRPRTYLRYRTLVVAVLRLVVFCTPYITELRVFDATVSSPSSTPFVGWAIDMLMVFVGGWLPLDDSAAEGPLCASAGCTSRAEQRTPGVLSLQWPPSDMLHRAGPPPCPAASRTWVMLLSSLGGQVPFWAHLAVQTVNFLILATHGTCFCDSEVSSN